MECNHYQRPTKPVGIGEINGKLVTKQPEEIEKFCTAFPPSPYYPTEDEKIKYCTSDNFAMCPQYMRWHRQRTPTQKQK